MIIKASNLKIHYNIVTIINYNQLYGLNVNFGLNVNVHPKINFLTWGMFHGHVGLPEGSSGETPGIFMNVLVPTGGTS